MISPALAIAGVALIFYVLIPGVGAFGVRRRWRLFRKRIIEASLRVPVTYRLVRSLPRVAAAKGSPARFVGALESIQGEHTAWVRGEDLTIAVDMSDSDVYLVAGSEPDRPTAPPTRTTWARVGSLPEGVKILVSGRLDTSEAHPVIRSDGIEPVLAVFYDGAERSLLRRSTWSGRQLNEYWNSVTPGALAGGSFALIILAYVLFQQPLSPVFGRLAIGLASVPVLPLLPPGVALFYLYRVGWRRGRRLRAHRDVLRLPLRYFGGDERCTELPTGEQYCRRELAFSAVGELVSRGLIVISPPVGRPSAWCTLFGRPGGEELVQAGDPLCEWVAVKGDPEEAAAGCQRRARWYEIGSLIVLAAGLFANFALLMVLLGYLI